MFSARASPKDGQVFPEEVWVRGQRLQFLRRWHTACVVVNTFQMCCQRDAAMWPQCMRIMSGGQSGADRAA